MAELDPAALALAHQAAIDALRESGQDRPYVLVDAIEAAVWAYLWAQENQHPFEEAGTWPPVGEMRQAFKNRHLVVKHG